MRTGTVRTDGDATISSGRKSRSEEAGGAAMADGASARGGAGMNDAGRGFSVESHAATGVPFECTRGRARRPRFFSASRAGGRAAGGGGGATGFGAGLGAGFGAGLDAALGAAFGGVTFTGFTTFAAAFF